MSLEIISFSVGTNNRPNEDACGIWSDVSNNSLIAAVADGVGGNIGGSVASNTAVEYALNELRKSPISYSDLFNDISGKLALLIEHDSSLENMATTLTLLTIENNVVKFGHVGDTRIYHLRSNGIVQKTKDQTEVALLVEQGVITPKRAKNYPRRSVLISALSASKDYFLQEDEFEIQDRDRLLLVSDGFYKVLSKKLVRDLSVKSNSLTEFKDYLYNELLRAELSDDATCVLISFHKNTYEIT